MSLLQSPRRPPSDALALGTPHEVFGAGSDARGGAVKRARDPDAAFFGGSGGFGDETDGPRVDLGRELDLSGERPRASAPEGRGPGVMVAAIVASSITLAGIIMLVRGDVRPTAPEEAAPAAITEVVGVPTELPAEPAPAEVAPIDPPDRVASQRVPEAAKVEAVPVEVTPAAIAPASSSRASAPATVVDRPVAPVEVAPSSALAPGLYLPAPVFDDPTPTPSDPLPVDDAPDPLPGIEERAPSEPSDESRSVPGTASEAAAQHTHADEPEPMDPVEHLDSLDQAPARAAS